MEQYIYPTLLYFIIRNIQTQHPEVALDRPFQGTYHDDDDGDGDDDDKNNDDGGDDENKNNDDDVDDDVYLDIDMVTMMVK
jgi:hypothetical protein